MINFEEELKKFYPSLEVSEVEESVYHQDLTDAVDVMLELMRESNPAAYGPVMGYETMDGQVPYTNGGNGGFAGTE